MQHETLPLLQLASVTGEYGVTFVVAFVSVVIAGLVLERRRLPHERDTFLWVCTNCHAELWRRSLHVTDITTQLQPVFQEYYSNPENLKCRSCGTVHPGRRGTAGGEDAK